MQRKAKRFRGFLARTSALVLLAMLGLTPASAKQMALLVGVSDYPADSVGDLQLAGPRHDAALMLETIQRAGFAKADITILADGLENTDAKRKADGLPTKAAIVSALAGLAERAQSGDMVLVYLSGHGSQQPDLQPDKRPVPKADGLDEVFLPLDIGPWQDAVQTVANALPDYEFAQAVNAIRAKGAFVWVVIDACHSGTMTRSATPGAVIKRVPPARLGIPQAAFDKARSLAKTNSHGETSGTQMPVSDSATHGMAQRSFVYGATQTTPTRGFGGLSGGYAAFFAAYPDQAAQQENLPKSFGPNPDKRPHGVLTFYLAQAMRSGHASSFKDLALHILDGYGQFGAEAPTPMFEGDLDTAFPGGGVGAGSLLPVKRDEAKLVLGAGALDSVSEGSLFALATGAAADTIKAYARVESVGANQASLALVTHEGVSADGADLPQEGLVARLVERGASLSLHVGFPAANAPRAKAVIAALEDMMRSPGAGFTIVQAAEGQSPDYQLRVEDDRLWLIGEGSDLVKSGRAHTRFVPLTSDDPASIRKSLEPALQGLAKVQNLLRIGAQTGGAALDGKLKIEQFLLRDTSPVPQGTGQPDAKPCPAASREIPAAAQSIAQAEIQMVQVGQCDLIYFRLTNLGGKPIDITPLYFDGGGAIMSFAPETGLRLEPKAKPSVVAARIKTWNLEKQQAEPVGIERMMFIGVEVEGRQAFAANFSHLAQSAPTRAATSAFGKVLEAAAFGKTREVSAPVTPDAAILTYRWMVRAPEGTP